MWVGRNSTTATRLPSGDSTGFMNHDFGIATQPARVGNEFVPHHAAGSYRSSIGADHGRSCTKKPPLSAFGTDTYYLNRKRVQPCLLRQDAAVGCVDWLIVPGDRAFPRVVEYVRLTDI